MKSKRHVSPATRLRRATPKLHCAPIPETPRKLEHRVHKCTRALAVQLREFAREFSPPVVLLALATQMSRLGRAHISSGLLSAQDLRQLVREATGFGAASSSTVAPRRKTPRRKAR